jgi:hypothetical protein
MNFTSRRDQFVLLAALFFVPFYILAQFPSLSAAPRAGSTTIAPGAAGVGVFFELKNKLLKNSAVRIRRPILEPASLQGLQSLLSPQIKPSDRETKLLKDWVRAGGTLVVSFLNAEAYQRVQTLITDAGVTEPPETMSAFENSTAATVWPSIDRHFLKAGESYEFYSYLSYQGASCVQLKQPCYVLEGQMGRGRVFVFAGLVPFSNGLIDHLNNLQLASRLALFTGRSGFDEYHLMIGEKTLTDLLQDPHFVLPVLGFLVGLFIFFFFGTSDFDEHSVSVPARPLRRSFHSLNRNLIQKVVNAPHSMSEAGQLHRKLLTRLLPEGRLEIDQIAERSDKHLDGPDDELTLVTELIEFHKKWLKSRGRK